MTNQKSYRLRRIALVGASALALGCVAVFWLGGPDRVVPGLPDSRLVTTTLPTPGISPTATWKDRVFLWLFKSQQRYRQRHPQPLAFSFPACPVSRCSVHGLLNQCMEVSGVRYLILKEVAAGTIQFGHTNVLNGAQWVAAFTEALTNGQPEWWDSRAKGFRKENLILVTNGPRTVMVLPREMVHEFQK